VTISFLRRSVVQGVSQFCY